MILQASDFLWQTQPNKKFIAFTLPKGSTYFQKRHTYQYINQSLLKFF